jgi:L-methionine (R)-S-oxide reductase
MKDRVEVAPATYDETLRELRTALQSVNDEIEAQELVCHQLYDRFDHYSWVGIYVVEGKKLILSAWSGPEETEHTTIEIGVGICGLAAKTGETEIVPDVSKRPEFIACFPTTRSEIVVPIHGPDRRVLGEIDIDSDWLDAFDDRDRKFLESIAAELSGIMAGS